MSRPAPVRIDLWSDLVCPWCWIGKHRLARALARPEAPPADIHWRPFVLEPEAGTEPVPLRQAYANKFGGAERAGQMLARTQATARAEGLPMDFDRGQVRVSTLDAHRVLGLASAQGVADAVSEALFRAHFEHGRNLAEPDTLIDAAAAGGIAAGAVRELLAGDEGIAQVQASVQQAQRLDIRSVPNFVLDRRLMISGAQPPEVFEQAFAELAAGRDAKLGEDAGNGRGDGGGGR